MKHLWILTFLTLLPGINRAQSLELSEQELQTKLDSILVEGNMLFIYEKAAWISCDLALEDEEVKKSMEGYLVYETDNGFKSIILGNDYQKCIAEYYFMEHINKADSTVVQERDLTPYEEKLIQVREKIREQLPNEEYKIGVPEGYSLNFVLIPFGSKYKFYIMTGTSQPDIIPFGNDYLFITDENGVIENWIKFHSTLIPCYAKMEDKTIVKAIHSHLKHNPLISATDICIFMMYAPIYGIKEFSVYGGGKIMNYNYSDNSITIQKRD
ncbi:MAG: hypothetical protein LUH22_14510 [Bacteroides sp.]|nr:hypothetical protein [Bacteroides sp.]